MYELERADIMGKKIITKTAADILSTIMQPREMIVEGLIPQGICILAGPQKVGKSFLALDLCISVASGQPVLGHETVRGECLISAWKIPTAAYKTGYC